MAAWIGGLVVIVALGLAGGDASGEPTAAGQSERPGAVSATAPGARTPSPTGAAATRVIVLREPPGPDAEVTTRDLVVRGYLSSGTGPVQIVLESSGGKPIAVRTVGPMTLGRWTDDPTPAFSVSFPLSNPRPGGVMTVQVVAYDLDGIPVDVVRRQVRIGAVEPRTLGDDGVMGGIVSGTDRP